MVRRIQDMVVIVTGASAGIGAALARELCRRGAKLVLAARRLNRLEDINCEFGGEHLCARCDVSREEDCLALVENAVRRFGRVDTVVCNAGYGLCKPVAATSPAEMRAILATNLLGTTDLIHHAVPVMARQEVRDGWRGQIVIVTSVVARRGPPYFGAYAATKCAQLGIAEALRVELGPAKIAVTSVHPMGTDTEFFEVAQDRGGHRHRSHRLEVRQSPQQVARAIVQGIVKPAPEVWPVKWARWALGMAVLMPGTVDRTLERYRAELERENGSTA
jgi:NAD(P)-dependent dehydrogenase (short-subunit alcohol dehydrogenase family)